MSGLTVKYMAIDLTIWSRHQDGPDPLDSVVKRKLQKNKAVCTANGWQCKPWAADVYGGLHPAARQMVARAAREVAKRHADSPPAFATAKQMVWRALSASVVARAAVHLVRHETPLFNDDATQRTEDWADDDQADIEQAELASVEPEEGEVILGISEDASVPLPDAFNHDPASGAHGAVPALSAERACDPHGVPPAQDFWSTAPNGPLGLALWPLEFIAVQGPTPVVVLSIHAAGRQRLHTQVSLSELVGRVQLHAAAA